MGTDYLDSATTLGDLGGNAVGDLDPATVWTVIEVNRKAYKISLEDLATAIAAL